MDEFEYTITRKAEGEAEEVIYRGKKEKTFKIYETLMNSEDVIKLKINGYTLFQNHL